MSLSPEEIERFRRLLIDQMTRLYRDVHADIREAMLREVEGETEPSDEADESQRLQLGDLRLTLAENDAQRAQMIEAALGRIRHGEFGVCVECGSEIGLDRLTAVPWAQCCVDCQESIEARTGTRAPTM